MTIRKLVLSGALIGLLAISPAYAQDSDDEQDEEYIGCGMLGAGVGAAVIAAGTAGGATAWTAGLSAAIGYGMHLEIEGYCEHVAAETVEAYENAMNNLGIQILWHTYHDPSMAWCLSIKKYDCIPYIEPTETPDPHQQLFVEQSWEAVRSAAEQLQFKGAGNQQRISPLALANALQTGFDNSGLQGSSALFDDHFSGLD